MELYGALDDFTELLSASTYDREDFDCFYTGNGIFWLIFLLKFLTMIYDIFSGESFVEF